MRIAVTGATGLLGNNVTRLALGRGIQVVAISRNSTSARSLEDLKLQKLDADITDFDSLDRIDGKLDAVIHSAAHIHIGWSQRQQGIQTNKNGTANAIRLAQKHQARLIHVSTVNTLAIGSADRIVDEQTPGDGQVPCTYVVSKRSAEQEVRQAIQQGGDAVIVYPGFMLGPWDWKPSSGRMIMDLRKGAPPLAPSGGCSICDPRDVADAILQAIAKAPGGSRYILAGENWTYFQLWREITKQFGARGPWTFLRRPGQIAAGSIGDLLGKLTGKEPLVNSAAIAMSSQYHWYSSQLAIDQLDYRIRPVDESIADAIDWMRQQKMFV
ncbi:MAG: NAD-dependent epimerase/dehydratase family protein [Planctomycetota bacterium]|jgi:dihydroflavonol-4-reductase